MRHDHDGRRYAEVSDTIGVCPYCLAVADITTITTWADSDEHPRYIELDTGSTQPLCGVLCPPCHEAITEGQPDE